MLNSSQQHSRLVKCSAMTVTTGKTMLGLLLLVMTSHLAASSTLYRCDQGDGCHGNQEFRGSLAPADTKARRSVPATNSAEKNGDLTRTKRDVSHPRGDVMAKRGDWSKTNVHMWGKRHGLGLLDMFQNEAARSRDKKDSPWGKNNVRMWGKRGYDDDDSDYVNYDWLELDEDVIPSLKRESKLQSAAVNDVGRVIPHPRGWTKNAWERNNMRIWG